MKYHCSILIVGILALRCGNCPLAAQTPRDHNASPGTTVCVADSQSRKLPPIDRLAPRGVGTATFSMGCFWCPDAVFGAVDGVVRTRVGFTGGATRNPTYDDPGDHIESIQVEYDPNSLNYANLLEIFWQHHDATQTPLRPQYQCAVFVANNGQEQLAKQSLARVVRRMRKPVATLILPATQFYPAEAYHQKFQLRQHPMLAKEMEAIYSNDIDIMNSTLCARLNAIIGGYGRRSHINDEVMSYGLSPAAHELVLQLISQLND